MQRRTLDQPDLFLIIEPPQNKLPSSERSRLVQLLGELMWSVLEPPATEAAPEEASDE